MTPRTGRSLVGGRAVLVALPLLEAPLQALGRAVVTPLLTRPVVRSVAEVEEQVEADDDDSESDDDAGDHGLIVARGPSAQGVAVEASSSGSTRNGTCVASAITVEARWTPSIASTVSMTRCRSALERETTRHHRSPAPVIV